MRFSPRSIDLFIARVHMRARRLRLGRWLLAAALAGVSALIVQHTNAEARTTLERYGELATVTVARHDLEPGARIASSDLETRNWPAGLVPADPVADPAGRTATAHIAAGEPIIAARVGSPDATGESALLQTDERGVAIPAEIGDLVVESGDRVDVIGTYPTSDPSEPPAVELARDARVIHTSEDSVTVAVPVEVADAVAYTLAQGRVILTLAP